MLIKKGDSISCRLPIDTPTNVIEYLNNIKNKGNRKFSSTISSFLIDKITEDIKSKEMNQITFVLPESISENQLKLITNPENQKLIISILLNSLKHKLDAIKTMEVPNGITEKAVPQNWRTENIEASTENFILNTFFESP